MNSVNRQQKELDRKMTRVWQSFKDVGQESVIIEMTGSSEKIDTFLTLLEGHEVLELARTGIAGLGRGIENVTYLD